MAYRDDVAALEARVDALNAEVEERARERDEAAVLLAEAKARAHAEHVARDLAAGGPAMRRRERIRIAAVVSALALIVAAGIAYGVSHGNRDDRLEKALQRFDRFADEMCQCADTACTQKVSDEMSKWSMEIQRDWDPPKKLDDATMKRATAIGERMAHCMTSVMQQQP